MFVTPPLISRINYCGPAAQNQTKQSSRVQHRSPALSLTRPISEKATSTLHMRTCTPRSTASHQTVLPSDIERTVPSLSISLRVATPPHHTNHAIIKEYGSVLYIMTASLRFFQASEKKIKMKPYFHILLLILFCNTPFLVSSQSFPEPETRRKVPDNETIYRVSKQLCWGCMAQSLEFLFAHNLVRAAKWELPFTWDFNLENYAKWWAGQRRRDCKVEHSFPEDGFKLGENIYWGNGDTWTPTDAVRAWADEEKYYRYATNTCEVGEICGHYTQIVWRNTRRIGCARVVCDSGDVFMTCNYDPVGNYIGERPYWCCCNLLCCFDHLSVSCVAYIYIYIYIYGENVYIQ